MKLNFTSEMEVELLGWAGSDQMIASAARVSTGAGLTEFDEKADAGLIRYLVAKKHGSPFEHNTMTFFIEAPIFVFREFQRHRVGFSYNEMSARYKKLYPKFYVYPEDRPMVQSGSSAHPDLVAGDVALTDLANRALEATYYRAWSDYESMLDSTFHEPIANEVARAVLPVGIYSSMYVTCNARSMMNFLMLRVDSEDNTFETKPQWEIQKVAEKMEAIFAELFPITYREFVRNGRVAP